MTTPPPTLQVAVPTPLYGSFDYLPPKGLDCRDIAPGSRVMLRFGNRQVCGLVLRNDGVARIDPGRLRPALKRLDTEPVIDPELLGLLQWAAEYYIHPIGEVISTALPVLLRQGEAASVRGIPSWHLSANPDEAVQGLKRAPRQAALVQTLAQHTRGLDTERLNAMFDNWRQPMNALIGKGLVEQRERPCLHHESQDPTPGPRLNPAQAEAVRTITQALGGFAPFLLEGVTGSGKTEVYLQIAEQALAAGSQALVLVPEIGLTPQLIERFRHRFSEPIAVLHSGLNDRERLCAWNAARSGEAPIVIGTRSAIFTPLARPGVIILDEEHDLSFKQQDGFRYHARDLAVVRARNTATPVVLGSATPSIETLNNVERGHYTRVHLAERAGQARHPEVQLLDVRRHVLEEGFSQDLLNAMDRHLGEDGQVLLFLNRRGYAPTLLCHDCGWVATCRRCDAHMTLHARTRRLHCHHCGAQRALDTRCPECDSEDLRTLGLGTERVEEALARHFPEAGIVRIDRDTTRRKGAMKEKLRAIHEGRHQILIGTQMLAKGHDFPQVTLVGILDVDQGLFSADFRAAERMAQLIVQVAGRAGRAERSGQVLIQTRHPEHPQLRTLIGEGYEAFIRTVMRERREAALPPFSHFALLRAEAVQGAPPTAFLNSVRQRLQTYTSEGLFVLGPIPAPMERRAGRYRAQLLIQADTRRALHAALKALAPELSNWPEARRVRWSLDIDPMEMF